MSFKLPSGDRGLSFRGGINKQKSFLSSASNFLSNSILNAGQAIEEANEVIHILLAPTPYSLTYSLTHPLAYSLTPYSLTHFMVFRTKIMSTKWLVSWRNRQKSTKATR